VRALREFVHREHFVSAETLEHEELSAADAQPLLSVASRDPQLANEEAQVVQDRARLIGRA
jgi:hypothetical protein